MNESDQEYIFKLVIKDKQARITGISVIKPGYYLLSGRETPYGEPRWLHEVVKVTAKNVYIWLHVFENNIWIEKQIPLNWAPNGSTGTLQSNKYTFYSSYYTTPEVTERMISERK